MNLKGKSKKKKRNIWINPDMIRRERDAALKKKREKWVKKKKRKRKWTSKTKQLKIKIKEKLSM